MMVMIYVTFGDKLEARSTISQLLDDQLIACGNVIDQVTSMYRWEGEVHEDVECIAILKTHHTCVDRVITVIERLHSYDVPAISVVEVTKNNEEFIKWLENCVKIA